MRTVNEFGGKGLPRAIRSEELPIFLGTSQSSCSWNASHPTINELTARWPFLFAEPLLGTNEKKLTQ
jgi:hypothetical protein